MEGLLLQTKQLDKLIDEVLPLLIEDEWQMASEKLPQVIEALNDMLPLVLQANMEEVSLELVKSVLTRLIFAMKVEDSIQLADILAYEVGGIMQSVYAKCEE